MWIRKQYKVYFHAMLGEFWLWTLFVNFRDVYNFFGMTYQCVS
ncbi:hypothetical protein BO443_190015 [Burkholderia orbicola]